MEKPLCVLTGANGYVGGRIAHYLEARGWRVQRWVRQQGPAGDSVPFQLGQPVDPGSLSSAKAVVHCAYDFGPRRWEEIYATNVIGSERLLQAARAAQTPRVVCISSLSAFAGCRSLYGKAKLAIEERALGSGADVVRPGLVWGNSPGGVFGALEQQVRSSKYIPLLVGGRQTQFLAHEEDLSQVILRLASDQAGRVAHPVSVFHPKGLLLREVLTELGQRLGRKPVFLPVPWQVAWLGLRTLEKLGAHPRFRSDSLIGLVYGNPNPQPNIPPEWGVSCRGFMER